MNHTEVRKRLRTNESLEEENLELRRLLCISYSVSPYLDDGEMQDNRIDPFIDFKRDHVTIIKEKIQDRIIKEYNENRNWKLYP